MKKKELLLAGAVVVVAAGMWVGMNWNRWFNAGADYYVEVQVGGALVQSIPMTATGTYTAANAPEGNENIFEITEDGVRMISASCPDKVCEGQGLIEPGTVLPICCLPNQVYIEIVAAEERKGTVSEGLYELNPSDYISSMKYDNLEYTVLDQTVTEEEIELAKEMYPEEYEAKGEEDFLEMLAQTKKNYMQATAWQQIWQQVMAQTEFSAVPEGEQFGDMDEEGRKEVAAYRYIAEKEQITVAEDQYLTGAAWESQLFYNVLSWLQENAKETVQ